MATFIDVESKEIFKEDLQSIINHIICELKQPNCTRVEFLRGKLSAYLELIESNDWITKQKQKYF
jgi:hypothetical protein